MACDNDTTVLKDCKPSEIDCKSKILTIGGDYFLFIEVYNRADKSLKIHNLEFVHETDTSNLIDLTLLSNPSSNENLPFTFRKSIILEQLEKFSCLFLITVKEFLIKDQELSLQLKIFWSLANEYKQIKELFIHWPSKLKIRRPLFSVLARCSSSCYVEERFEVTYVLTNQLQDFTVALRWCPKTHPVSIDNKEYSQIETTDFPARIICHNPDTIIQRCSRGTETLVKVSFSVLQSGVLELVEQMQVDLNYTKQVEDMFDEIFNEQQKQLKRIKLIDCDKQISPIIYENADDDCKDSQNKTQQIIINRENVNETSENHFVGVKLILGKLCEHSNQIYAFKSM